MIEFSAHTCFADGLLAAWQSVGIHGELAADSASKFDWNVVGGEGAVENVSVRGLETQRAPCNIPDQLRLSLCDCRRHTDRFLFSLVRFPTPEPRAKPKTTEGTSWRGVGSLRLGRRERKMFRQRCRKAADVSLVRGRSRRRLGAGGINGNSGGKK